MVVHTYNPSTQKLRQEDCEFEYSYIVKVCKKERKRERDRERENKRNLLQEPSNPGFPATFLIKSLKNKVSFSIWNLLPHWVWG
jgi:hypothetical protein